MNINKISCGKLNYSLDQGKGTYAYSYSCIGEDAYTDICRMISDAGYNNIRSHTLGNNKVKEYTKNDGEYIITVYYPHIDELTVVTESHCEFAYRENLADDLKYRSSITQIYLEDFGLSYVIMLGDGKFIIIDGGLEYDFEAEKIMNCLKEKSPNEKPVIAAWIMTHAHIDHYRCFMPFAEKYGDGVVIESFIYNFPNLDSTDAIWQKALECEKGETEHIIRFEKKVEELGIKTYRAHTGQIYDISNAHIEMLSSPDDMFREEIDDYNKLSLIFKMTLEGQTVLWCGDAYFKPARLAKRWGQYLKSDILQVPHHGFCGGEPEEYDIIKPEVCMWTVSEEDGYVRINEFQPNSHYLMHNTEVKEHIMGYGENAVLPLPYTPNPNGRIIHNAKMEKAQKSIGATSWFFDDMSKGECEFTFINSCSCPVYVYADLYFEQPKDFVQNIKITLKPYCRTKVNLFNPDQADPHAMKFDRSTLQVKGMPENEKFAIHFKSDKPYVVAGCKKEIYHD